MTCTYLPGICLGRHVQVLVAISVDLDPRVISLTDSSSPIHLYLISRQAASSRFGFFPLSRVTCSVIFLADTRIPRLLVRDYLAKYHCDYIQYGDLSC